MIICFTRGGTRMNLCADKVFDKMLLWRDMATKVKFPSCSAAELPDLRRRSRRMISCRAAGADGGRVAVGDDVFSVTTSSKYEVEYLGQSTKGDLNLKLDPLQSFGDGQATLEGPIEEVARTEAHAAENLIRELGIQVELGTSSVFRFLAQNRIPHTQNSIGRHIPV